MFSIRAAVSSLYGCRAIEPGPWTMTPTPAARLLVVDDNRTNRLILERGLTAQGFAVLEAESGSAALDLLAATLGQAPRESPGPDTIDLVLLDMIMQEEYDGLQTYQAILELTHIRKSSSPAATPRINGPTRPND